MIEVETVSAREQAPLTLDGSHGEGGGQIVRTALALAAVSDAEVSGDAFDSTSLSFGPRGLRGHLETVAWTTRQFLPATIELVDARPACVVIAPK